jgi:predicted ATP-binding protein involved in virulence
MDYDVYLEMVEYENEIEKINNYKKSIEWYKRKLEKLNKLISEL